METWKNLFKNVAIIFGVIGALSGMATHEISQARELENNKTVLEEQGKE